MLVGLDVGGTFTDAVVVADGRILKINKAGRPNRIWREGMKRPLAG